MSEDMSMFKKMKERIADEVNSATNKFQNMQIIDQFTTNLGHQSTHNGSRSAAADKSLPNLPLPELDGLENKSSSERLSNNRKSASHIRQFSLVEDSMITSTDCDEELDTRRPPQRQLFNESPIRRLEHSDDRHETLMNRSINDDETVIDLTELSSDLDDDVEIDLLSGSRDELGGLHTNAAASTTNYRSKYRNLVHALRKLDRDRKGERNKLTDQVRDQNQQLETLQRELNSLKQNSLSASSSQSEITDRNVSSDGRLSPHQATGGSSNIKLAKKVKDLERLIAKCKDSLKAKNSQLQILKDALIKVDQFKLMMDGVKSDLADLKKTYDTWTVLIAENKRVMHREIEDKTAEMDKYKAELKEMQLRMKNQSNNITHLKMNIQNLESRLVSTSAAHQKERESLIKELNSDKNNALKQQHKEHELQIERFKLDFEKMIEALKSELLSKDEQIIRGVEYSRELQEKNQQHLRDLEDAKKELDDKCKDIERLKSLSGTQTGEISKHEENHREGLSSTGCDESLALVIKSLEADIEDYRKKCKQLEVKCSESEIKNQKLLKLQEANQQLTTKLEELNALQEKLNVETAKCSDLGRQNSILDDQVSKLERKLEDCEKENNDLKSNLNETQPALEQRVESKVCQKCLDFEKEATKTTERYEQAIHELNGRLDLLTTANNDQERALSELECKYDGAIKNSQTLKVEFDESVKKNESLLQVIQDNESEIQRQQDQIDKLTSLEQEIKSYKSNNSLLSTSLNQIKQELNERNLDLIQSKEQRDILQNRLIDLEDQVKDQSKNIESLRCERDSLLQEAAEESKRRTDIDKQLVVNILTALKNLETPDNSPRSDKTLNQLTDKDRSSDDNDDWSLGEQSDSVGKLSEPDPLRLAKELSNLATNRANTYMTANQRLQAVLLDNSMISEELRRLRDEINSLNHGKSQEVQSSLDEIERLRTENQALIHDQKAYEDHVADLETEIESLNRRLDETTSVAEQAKKVVDRKDVSIETQEDQDRIDLEAKYNELDELLRLKEDEVKYLKAVILELQAGKRHQEPPTEPAEPSQEPEPTNGKYVPDSTEFEYLKNIVYQFMIGREPLTLARVISAVFKFDKNQVDQICKIQEAIHQISG